MRDETNLDTTATATTTPRTGRGAPLTALLVIMTLAQLAGIVIGVMGWRSLVAQGAPHVEVALIGVALSIAGLVAAAGTWQWWKWAVVLYTALTVLGVAMDVSL